MYLFIAARLLLFIAAQLIAGAERVVIIEKKIGEDGITPSQTWFAVPSAWWRIWITSHWMEPASQPPA